MQDMGVVDNATIYYIVMKKGNKLWKQSLYVI